MANRGRRELFVTQAKYYQQAKRNLESGVVNNWTDTTGQINLLDESDLDDADEATD